MSEMSLHVFCTRCYKYIGPSRHDSTFLFSARYAVCPHCGVPYDEFTIKTGRFVNAGTWWKPWTWSKVFQSASPLLGDNLMDDRPDLVTMRFVIAQEGIYKHDIYGPFESADAAIAEFDAYYQSIPAATDNDDFLHDFDGHHEYVLYEMVTPFSMLKRATFIQGQNGYEWSHEQ